MKKNIAGLALGIIIIGAGSICQAHIDLNSKQIIESLRARIAMLQVKLALKQKEQAQLETSIATLKKNEVHVPQSMTVLAARLSIVKEDIQKLKEALRVNKNSLKPLMTIK